MTLAPSLTPEFVQFIPERLEEGVLYISKRYRTASHRCCCGCGLEVVTPLNPAKWRLTEHPDGSVSLSPSIGNWGFPCRSHYLVTQDCVSWAGAMSSTQIEALQVSDQRAVAALAAKSGQRKGFWNSVQAAWAKLREAVHGWWHG